jgi:hypothetical protein
MLVDIASSPTVSERDFIKSLEMGVVIHLRREV